MVKVMLRYLLKFSRCIGFGDFYGVQKITFEAPFDLEEILRSKIRVMGRLVEKRIILFCETCLRNNRSGEGALS
ncbi:hypothetical protein TNCV_1399491 [Trichonephila clavipes]|nr:hypothetical protein TNCV_1399491 [Trichonephila clavipes]